MKLTKKDVLKKREKIEEYKEALKRINSANIEEGLDKEFLGFTYRPNQVTLREQSEIYLSLIRREEREILEAEIVNEKDLSENCVGLGDNLTLLLEYANGEVEEYVGEVSDVKEDFHQFITTDSPIGKAIYGKEVGSEVQCLTPIGLLKITILKKNTLKR